MDAVHELVSRVYQHAAENLVDQFRSFALAELARLLNAAGAFWGLGRAEISDSASAVVRYGATPGRGAPHEMVGKSNPNWSVYGPLARNRDSTPQYTHRHTLTSISELHSTSGYQVINVYRRARQPAFSESEAILFRQLAEHLASALELSFRLACRHDPQNLVASAITDRSGWILHCHSAFRTNARKLLKSDSQMIAPSEFGRNLFSAASDFGTATSVREYGSLLKVSVSLIPDSSALSPRENQVLQGIVDGESDKAIAKTLGVSPSTVSNHVHRILRKTGHSNRRELAIAERQRFTPS